MPSGMRYAPGRHHRPADGRPFVVAHGGSAAFLLFAVFLPPGRPACGSGTDDVAVGVVFVRGRFVKRLVVERVKRRPFCGHGRSRAAGHAHGGVQRRQRRRRQLDDVRHPPQGVFVFFLPNGVERQLQKHPGVGFLNDAFRQPGFVVLHFHGRPLLQQRNAVLVQVQAVPDPRDGRHQRRPAVVVGRQLQPLFHVVLDFFARLHVRVQPRPQQRRRDDAVGFLKHPRQRHFFVDEAPQPFPGQRAVVHKVPQPPNLQQHRCGVFLGDQPLLQRHLQAPDFPVDVAFGAPAGQTDGPAARRHHLPGRQIFQVPL